MKTLFLSFIVLFAVQSQGRTIEVAQPSLGVLISINGDSNSQVLASIVGDTKETEGVDYSDLVKGINKVIANHSRDFLAVEAKILPYKEFLTDYKHDDLALVVRGKVSPDGYSDTLTFFIPIESLLWEKKNKIYIHWFVTEGNIWTDRNEKFNEVDLGKIFRSDEPGQELSSLNQ